MPRRGSRAAPRIRSDGMKTPFVLACALALAFAGCTKSSDTSIDDHDDVRNRRSGGLRRAAAGAKTIGVSIQNREAQFYQDMEPG